MDIHQDRTTDDLLETNSFNEKFLKRKRKLDKEGRKYECIECKISYMSYPALYTHQRNKHSLIPIITRNKAFKSHLIKNSKFKYSKGEIKSKSLNEINFLKTTYKEIFEKYSMNAESYFYNPFSSLQSDYLAQLFEREDLLNKKYCQKYDLSIMTIGEVLILYLVMMVKLSKNETFLQLLVLFMYLVTEYLDMFGWEYYHKMMKIGIVFESMGDSNYCKSFNCDNLPVLMNDFVSFFLYIDDSIAKQDKELTDICHNFCIWLNSRKFTSFRIERYQE